jgi:hypothetical protein
LSSNNQPTSKSISTLSQLKTGNLPKLKLSKTAKSTILSNEIKTFIVNDIMLIPNFETMKTDLELVKHICNMVQELNRKEVDPKIDKKAIVLDVLKILFPDLSIDQTMMIDTFIDFICQNDMVNKLSSVSKFVGSLKKIST